MRYELRELESRYESRIALWRVDDDGTETELALDGGEPEDQTLNRDWAWVCPELNRLARRIKELEDRA